MVSKLLIVIDPLHETQPAYLRAVELAQIREVALHVVLFQDLTRPQALPGVGENPTGHPAPDQWLQNLVQPQIDEGLTISTEVRPFRRLFEEIIRVALAQDAIFVFKPMRFHSLVKRTFFTSTDWNLIRTCPIPLLLINDVRPLRGRDIVVAIDVSAKDTDHAELNRILMSQARMVANIFGSTIKVINALPLPAIPVGLTAGGPVVNLMLGDLRSDHRRRAESLAREFEVTAENVEVIEGPAELVVNRFARETDAGVVILGTVARTGLAGVFVGNTAERLLEESSCDVIVVKQADFKSPIQ